ncbi:division/cell wall cluster transcriptional repressor MraZ [Adhaeretor mobilis]|uniref:Transcriptional regulator MraZ n=1 Tax=Adhaeretor mobilis TaxID=1930276 RepID=A0A517MT80_9BACT|nr:division/cell wall cluster transcriptional repressor MraZ [Adhaeretor mobilis]QDS98091.1 MraZ-like protein [Adhaeretor mobilis]
MASPAKENAPESGLAELGAGLFVGEWSRSLDERYRVSLPTEWAEAIAGGADSDSPAECTLAKERPGCVSIWRRDAWQHWLAEGLELVQGKIKSGRLARQGNEVQMLGRLLSTRHKTIPVTGRGRIAIPDSFREFLGVEPGGSLLVVGAATCIELWRPEAWGNHIGEHMPGFRELFEQLAS